MDLSSPAPVSSILVYISCNLFELSVELHLHEMSLGHISSRRLGSLCTPPVALQKRKAKDTSKHWIVGLICFTL